MRPGWGYPPPPGWGYRPPAWPGRRGGGVLVLVLVTLAVLLVAPHARALRPQVKALRGILAGQLPDLPTIRLPRLLPTIRLPRLLPAPPPGRGPAGGPACPVAGRFTYGSGWGDCRDGCSRRHQGIDLVAPAGTRLVAVEDGRIGTRWGHDGGNAGIRLWLIGRSGTAYFYAHNRRNLVRPGQRVRRGQPVAEVGATGNAAGGPPHLHFQVHPGGGPPVNADQLVRRWCG